MGDFPISVSLKKIPRRPGEGRRCIERSNGVAAVLLHINDKGGDLLHLNLNLKGRWVQPVSYSPCGSFIPALLIISQEDIKAFLRKV